MATPTTPISPSAEDPRSQKLERIRAVLEQASQDFPGQAGLLFHDLELGQTVGVGTDLEFEAASLIKLPVLVELYRRLEAGDIPPDEEMVFEERFRVQGSGHLKDQEAGSLWRLTELARLMIQESDNVATDMLIERLGMAEVNHQMSVLGLQQTVLARGIYDFEVIEEGQDNLTSAGDVGLLLQELGEGRLPGSTQMHQLLMGQKRNDMIPARLPEGTTVAHKTGQLLSVLHDAGIVYTPRGSYVLVFLGQGFQQNPDEIEQFWADLSLQVHTAYLEIPGPAGEVIPPEGSPSPGA